MKIEMVTVSFQGSDYLSLRQFILVWLSKIIRRLTKSAFYSCYLATYNIVSLEKGHQINSYRRVCMT